MKYFSIEQAERTLPVVERLVKKAQRLRDRLAWLLETNDVVLEVSSDEGFHYFVTEQIRVNKEFHKLYYQFYRTVEQLDDIGVLVKDIDDGLIDFAFKMNGRDVFWSWQLGEDKIRFWFDPESGMESRQPIVNVDELLNQ